MFHICPDEILMLMMAMPFVGGFFHWLRHKLRRKPCSESDRKDSCSLEPCEHSEKHSHIYDPLDPG